MCDVPAVKYALQGVKKRMCLADNEGDLLVVSVYFYSTASLQHALKKNIQIISLILIPEESLEQPEWFNSSSRQFSSCHAQHMKGIVERSQKRRKHDQRIYGRRGLVSY